MTRADRLRTVLDGLLKLVEQHRDELWAEIDHRDPEAVETGTARYRDFLERADAFRTAASRLADAFEETGSLFDDVLTDEVEAHPSSPEQLALKDGERPVRQLDPDHEHALDEEFTHTKPVAVRIQDTRYEHADSWRRVYELVCKHLAERDPERFSRLPSDSRFISARDRHDFSRRSQDLRTAAQITDDVFAEVHFSANDLRKRIVKLLDAFGLPASSVGIYLRSDRPA